MNKMHRLAVSQTLTASYVAGNNSGTALVATVGGSEQLIMYIEYTPKTGQSNRNATVQLEFSNDGTIWHPLTKGVDGGVSGDEIVTTLYRNAFKVPGATGGTRYEMRIPVALGDTGADAKQRYHTTTARVMVKEDGSANFGAVNIYISTYKEQC